MRLVVGARINDRNISAPHDKGVRSLEGEGAGFIAGYPSDKRRNFYRRSERRFKIHVEFDFIHEAKVLVAPGSQPN